MVEGMVSHRVPERPSCFLNVALAKIVLTKVSVIMGPVAHKRTGFDRSLHPSCATDASYRNCANGRFCGTINGVTPIAAYAMSGPGNVHIVCSMGS